MHQITKQEVQNIAHLARIQLSEDEAEKYTKDLSAILDYVKQLEEVDTENVPITAQVTGLTNITRDDDVENSPNLEDALSQAPSRDGDGIKVKEVFS